MTAWSGASTITQTFTLAGGELTGDGDFTIAHDAMWSGGQMTGAGRKRGPTAETKVARQSWRRPDVVPDEIARLIKRSPTAWANLLAQAPSYRKQWVTWLENAKRPETREKRARDTIARLERNEKPGMEYRTKPPPKRG